VSAHHYCTYFDHRYLARGLALHASLCRVSPGHTLWVLSLSKECEELLHAAALPGIRVIPLADLEARDPELAATRSTRSLVEYYFTCSPCLPRYILHEHPEVGAITYVDSDLYFFSSPDPIFAEIGDAPIAITPHRFPPAQAAELERYGRYNVGWLTFRRSAMALACLDWWRERCLEWCFDRLEGDRFADQKYLDQFENRFPSTHAITHPGANLAPWNVANHRIENGSGGVTVDGRPVVFYHFQGLKQIRPMLFDTHLDDYDTRLTPELKRLVYVPYLRDLCAAGVAAAKLGLKSAPQEYLRSSDRGFTAFRLTVNRLLATARAALKGNLIRLDRTSNDGRRPEMES
jgi:hypothetical protein